MCVIEGDKRDNGIEATGEVIIAENFPTVKKKYKTTDPGSSENTKQNKKQANTACLL